jgi:ATP-dependent HslUV protease subunit HslV
MSTVVGALIGQEVVIGSDSLLMQGETRLSAAYGHNPKLFVVGDSCVGLTGTAAHYMPLILALRDMGDDCDLWGAEAIFRTFSKLHKKLKDEFFLNPKKQTEDAYEANHISAMVANGSGLFGVYAHREVLHFGSYWANGSGRAYALGAMHSRMHQADAPPVNAPSLVRAALAAAIEFDRSTGGAMQLYQFELGQRTAPVHLG